MGAALELNLGHPLHTGSGACELGEGTNLALKPKEYITRSPKQGYQWSHKKDRCPPMFFFKKKKRNSFGYKSELSNRDSGTRDLCNVRT